MKKAQTSIEVLLLLGGAILVTVIIGIALKNIGSESANQTTNTIKCTITDCTSCKTTNGCAGYRTDGTTLFTGATTNPECDATEKTLFYNCKPT